MQTNVTSLSSHGLYLSALQTVVYTTLLTPPFGLINTLKLSIVFSPVLTRLLHSVTIFSQAGVA